MRRQSSTLVMAANQNSAIDVLFGAQSNGNVGMLGFQRGNALEFQKKLLNFFVSNFGAAPWHDNFSSTNQRRVKKWR